MCVAYCYITMYVQSLSLEGCFHIYLLKDESFSVLTLKLSLRRGRAHAQARFCDILNCLEASRGLIFSLRKCDVKT